MNSLEKQKALIIVDIQNDFMPGGALAVPRALEIIETINALMDRFSIVVASLDDHPSNHVSFAKSHIGCAVGEEIITARGLKQILWPPHCIHNTFGCKLYEGLKTYKITHMVSKGNEEAIDSYSIFFDNGRQKSTGLEKYLSALGVKKVTIVGVATEYCVLHSALDAKELGFEVEVIEDACRGIGKKPQDVMNAFEEMEKKGITVARYC